VVTGEARLVAVADPSVERLAASKAELAARGVRWHLDYREMLDREDLDAVVIATPIPFHFEMAKACIERGLFVQLEKPPVPLIGQLEELIAADANGRVSVGFQMISAQCTQVLKQSIIDGKLGQVQEIRAGACWPRFDSYYSRASWAGRMVLGDAPVFDGPATNGLAHIIHDVMYLAAGERDGFDTPIEMEGEIYRARPMESYDTACMRGRFGSGIAFSIAVTHATQVELPFRIEVHGTKGWARLSEDGAILESNVGVSCNHPQTTQQLLDINYAHFMDVACARRERFSTALPDTRGYVNATNAMLASSGCIHEIGSSFIGRYTQGDEKGYNLTDARSAVKETLKSGRMFSEQGYSWATAKPAKITLPLDSEATSGIFFRTAAIPPGIRVKLQKVAA